MQPKNLNRIRALLAPGLIAFLGVTATPSFGQQWNPTSLEEQTAPPAPFINQAPVLSTKPNPSTANEISSEDGQRMIPRPKPKAPNQKTEDDKPENNKDSEPNGIPVVVTPDAASASFNNQMITRKPGLQDPANYPVFLDPTTGKTRECILSGFERRLSVDPSGNTTYEGTLPNLRMVASDLVDIPSWHPPESGCIISISHGESAKPTPNKDGRQ